MNNSSSSRQVCCYLDWIIFWLKITHRENNWYPFHTNWGYSWNLAVSFNFHVAELNQRRNRTMTLHFYMDPKQSTGSTDCRHFSHNRLHCCITIEFLYYVEDLNFFPQLRPYSPIQNRNIQCGGAIIQQHRPGGGWRRYIVLCYYIWASIYTASVSVAVTPSSI